MKTLRFGIQIVLGVALPLALQLWHRRQLTPAARAASWNSATWAAALYAFGPASMLGWAWVTRCAWRTGPAGRAALGLGLGLLSTVVLFLVIYAADQIVAFTLDLPP